MRILSRTLSSHFPKDKLSFFFSYVCVCLCVTLLLSLLKNIIRIAFPFLSSSNKKKKKKAQQYNNSIKNIHAHVKKEENKIPL